MTDPPVLLLLRVSLEPLLHRLHEQCSPPPGAQQRVLGVLRAKTAVPASLHAIHQALHPSAEAKNRVWNRVSAAMHSPAENIFGTIRAHLDTPQPALAPMLARLRPAPEDRAHPFFRWGAAVAVIAILASLTPSLLIGPSTVARATIVIRPMEGDVFVAHASTLEPLTVESEMETAVRLRTGDDGAVTVAAYDDYVVRLDHGSDVEWYDLTDRPEASIGGPTLVVHSGRLWIQGLVPEHVRGVTVATPAGDIVLHEGSADIAVDGTSVTVRVFDRAARVVHDGRTLALAAGEATTFSPAILPAGRDVRSAAYAEAWVTRNLGYDAVHRKDIAQWQQERRAAQAGILPTSPLYPAKRVLERVAELTTLTEEGRVQQKLAQADARLNEAVALISEGDTEEASASLDEYRGTLLELASGCGGSIAQFLIRQQVAEDTSGFAAAAPDDDTYLLKQTALEAAASLPEHMVTQEAVEDSLLVDRIAAFDRTIVAGDVDAATGLYRDLHGVLATLETNAAVAPIVRKQGQAVLRRYALALREGGTEDPELLQATLPFLPKPVVDQLPLSAQEVSVIVGGILDRSIGVYSTERGQSNSLVQELRTLEGHPDEPRILEQLLLNVENNALLAPYVRGRIRDLRVSRGR